MYIIELANPVLDWFLDKSQDGIYDLKAVSLFEKWKTTTDYWSVYSHKC